jgi:hypothetical protein
MSAQDNPQTSDETPQYYAVFGDIHGRVALMYTLAQLWEQQTGNRLAGILQVGDMGAYPDPTRVDKATQRHAARDSDELDFHNYCHRSHSGQRFLGHPDAPPTLFIRGNHEDFEYLGSFSQPTPIDPWDRMTYIPDGHIVDFQPEWNPKATPLRVAGFGGVHPKEVSRGRGQRQRRTFRKVQDEAVGNPKYFCLEHTKTAFVGEPIDVLMTHAAPYCAKIPRGSEALEALAERVRPRFHFFGHHHAVVGPTRGPGDSWLIGLDHLDFNKQGKLADSSWGILLLEPGAFDFTFATHDNFPWLHDVRRQTYRHRHLAA